MQDAHKLESMALDGRNLGRELHDRLQADAVRGSLPALLVSLDRAIVASETGLNVPLTERETHL